MDPVSPRTVFGVAAALPLVAVLGFYLGSRDPTSRPYEDDAGTPPTGQQASLAAAMGRPVDAVPLKEPIPPPPDTQLAQAAAKPKPSKDDTPKSSAPADADATPDEAPVSAPPEMDTPAAAPPAHAADDANTPPY